MSTVFNWLLTLVVTRISGLSAEEWTRIKNLVLDLEDRILPNTAKHGQVVAFVNTLVKDLTSTVLDFIVKAAVITVRGKTTVS